MPTRDVRGATAAVALVLATAVWGSTFLVTKESLAGTAPAAFLLWRFGLAAAVLVLVRPGRLLALDGIDVRRGTWLGVALGTGFLLQTSGLQQTTAGMSGFLTGTAVLLTPVVATVLFGEAVGRAGWAAVGVATTGLALLTLRDATLSAGAAVTLAGAACFAVHITCLSRWATARNAHGLTAWSVAVAALLCGAVAAVQSDFAAPATGDAVRAVVYLALAATCLGFVVQAWAQSVLSATTAAVIMTSEPVFAAAIAVGVGGEPMAPLGWLGGALVVVSMFVAELGPRQCCDALAPRVECC